MLQNALLDFFEAKMVAVKNFSGLLQVVAVLRYVVPRQVEHQLEVVALDAKVGHLRIHALQAGQFLLKLLGSLCGPILL